MHRHIPTTTICLALLAGCVSYKPAPVDFARDTAEWRNASLRICPQGHALSQGEMHRIGLLLNPELNQARLTHAKSEASAQFAGMWEDPSLSLEAERVLKENITNPAISVGLTPPVTGLPALAKRIAEQYAEADYWNLREQERQYLAGLDSLRSRIMTAHAKRGLMRSRLEQLRDEHARITRLYEIGEADLSDYQSATQRLNDTIKDLQELDKDHLTLHQEMTQKLGLHPDVGELELAGELPKGVPLPVAAPHPDLLADAPAIKAVLAGYGASEDELRAEIRKQYPELSLSPGFIKEDDEKKLKLGLDFSLPIWNRNREAIAKASGDRDLKRHDTVQAWRQLMQQSSNLQQQQQLARRHCQSEHDRLAGLQLAADQQEKLYDIGETSLPALAEARHEIYQRRLSYLDCLSALLDIQVQLQYLNPHYTQP